MDNFGRTNHDLLYSFGRNNEINVSPANEVDPDGQEGNTDISIAPGAVPFVGDLGNYTVFQNVSVGVDEDLQNTSNKEHQSPQQSHSSSKISRFSKSTTQNTSPISPCINIELNSPTQGQSLSSKFSESPSPITSPVNELLPFIDLEPTSPTKDPSFSSSLSESSSPITSPVNQKLSTTFDIEHNSPQQSQRFILGISPREPILQQLQQLTSFQNGASFLLNKKRDGKSLHRRHVRQVALSIAEEMEDNGMTTVPKVGYIMRELYEKLNHPLPEIDEDNILRLYEIVEEAFVDDFLENQRSEIDDEIVSDYIKFIRSNYAFY